VQFVADAKDVLEEPHDLQIAGPALRRPRWRAVVDEVLGDERADALDVVRGERVDDLSGQLFGGVHVVLPSDG
jgi:hypothetical protein